MKAMIFAAGLGTRLKPITDTIPKALVPIGGKTLLEHTITKLAEEGFDEQIINVHHHAEKIIEFLKEKNNFGIRIEISDECEMLLDTGGGIRKAAHFFEDGAPFLVHNVDILSNAKLKDLYDAHLQDGNDVTLLVKERETSRYLYFGEDNLLKGWMNLILRASISAYEAGITSIEGVFPFARAASYFLCSLATRAASFLLLTSPLKYLSEVAFIPVTKVYARESLISSSLSILLPILTDAALIN